MQVSKSAAAPWLRYGVLTVGGILMLMPFVWMILASFKTGPEIATRPIIWLPSKLRWENYAEVVSILDFKQLFFNSLFVTTSITLGMLLFSSMTGYALAKFQFFGAKAYFIFIVSTMMIPFFVLLIPVYYIVRILGWVDSFAGLIVPHMITAFGIFLMRQFMMGIPDELLDAARIDGASEFGIFARIVLPLAKPGLSALGIFAFVYQWDEFLWALLVISSPEKMTIPLGLNRLWNPNAFIDYNLFMAGSTLAVLPVLIVFFIAQKQLIEGIVMSGLKG